MNVLHSQPDRTPAMTRHSPHKQTIIIIHSGTFQLIARFVRIRNLSYSLPPSLPPSLQSVEVPNPVCPLGTMDQITRRTKSHGCAGPNHPPLPTQTNDNHHPFRHVSFLQLIARFVRIRNLSYSDTVYVGSGNKIFVLYFDMMMQEDDE